MAPVAGFFIVDVFCVWCLVTASRERELPQTPRVVNHERRVVRATNIVKFARIDRRRGIGAGVRDCGGTRVRGCSDRRNRYERLTFGVLDTRLGALYDHWFPHLPLELCSQDKSLSRGMIRERPWLFPSADNRTPAPAPAGRMTSRSPSNCSSARSAARLCRRTWCAPTAVTIWAETLWRPRSRSRPAPRDCLPRLMGPQPLECAWTRALRLP